MRFATLLYVAGMLNFTLAAYGLGRWLLRPKTRASVRFWTIPAIAACGGLFLVGPTIMAWMAEWPSHPVIREFLASDRGGISIFGFTVLTIQAGVVDAMKKRHAEHKAEEERARQEKIRALTGP